MCSCVTRIIHSSALLNTLASVFTCVDPHSSTVVSVFQTWLRMFLSPSARTFQDSLGLLITALWPTGTKLKLELLHAPSSHAHAYHKLYSCCSVALSSATITQVSLGIPLTTTTLNTQLIFQMFLNQLSNLRYNWELLMVFFFSFWRNVGVHVCVLAWAFCAYHYDRKWPISVCIDHVMLEFQTHWIISTYLSRTAIRPVWTGSRFLNWICLQATCANAKGGKCETTSHLWVG